MTEKLNSSNLRQNPRNVNELVNELTLFDDDLMSRVFDKNIEATEYVLQIILGRKIKVVSVKGQENFKNPVTNGRNITLDVHAEEEDGQEIDIEDAFLVGDSLMRFPKDIYYGASLEEIAGCRCVVEYL